MTAGPAARVGALLALYAPVADDIFVAVDDRADPSVAAAALDAGARVVRYPYLEPVDRPLAWLHERCRGDWVLTIDDDEVPSAPLLDALPELVAARDVTHYWLPRRWLYPTADRWLDEPPWRPDFQLRLVENDPRLLRFFAETHRPIEVVGPGRYLELPVYHADCVLNPLERRAQKALKYERLRPGKRVAGGAMSHVFYLPERRPDARTAAVPADDLRLVEQVLGAPEPPAGAAPDVPAATREEIDRLWVGRELPADAYAARIELPRPVQPFTAGEQRALEARVENRGSVEWPWGELGVPEIRVSYRWRDAGGAALAAEELRTPFPAPVPPGATAVLPVHVVAPAAPGRHVLELDLVHEHVRWFGCELRVDVEVEPPRRVAVAGSAAAVAAALERLADAAPELEPVVLGDAPPGYRRLRGRGRALLRELAGTELLVVTPPEPGTRALLAALRPALAARAAGVRVVADGVAARGAVDRALAALLRRVAADEPLEAAAARAAGRTG